VDGKKLIKRQTLYNQVMKVVNFISGAGCGKSTMSALLYAELKMLHKSAEIVPEFAKWLIYRGQLDKLRDQYYVSSKQYEMIKAVDGKVEYCIADSGIFTGLFYNMEYPDNVSDVKKTEAMIMERMGEFQNIYIYLERNDEYPFEKEGRVHNEEQSREIDVKIRRLMDSMGIEYICVKSDRSNITEIIEYVLSK
jgi:hypothetical protein